MTIGMRSNPYGNAVAENPTQIRRTMGHIDPRHRGLFGAAWAVGVLESTENSLVQSLCLAAPTGPFGLAFEPRDWPQEGFDGDDTARVYPLFHVFRAAASMSGEMRLTFESLPKGVAAYGISNGSGPRMMIANVTAEPVTVQLQRSFPFAILDSASLPQAKADPNWLSTAARTDTNTLHLGPFAIAFGGQTT